MLYSRQQIKLLRKCHKKGRYTYQYYRHRTWQLLANKSFTDQCFSTQNSRLMLMDSTGKELPRSSQFSLPNLDIENQPSPIELAEIYGFERHRIVRACPLPAEATTSQKAKNSLNDEA